MAEGEGNDKTVPEKDLIAVKKAAEREREKLDSQIKELSQELDSEKKSRLTADSSLKKIEKELTQTKASLGDIDKLKADLELAQKSGKESSSAVLDLTKKLILISYEIEESKLEGKTLEQLQQYQEVLSDVGKKREPGQKFDAGGAGGIVTEGKTGRQMIKEGLALKEAE